MSDENNGTSSYISIGTVRVRIGKDGDTRKMLFSPTKDFSVSHAGKYYAAFLCADAKGSCGILVQYKSNKGVPIRVGGKFAGLVQAAVQQSAVEIRVTEKDSSEDCKKRKFCLRAITIPAGEQTK